MTTPKTTWAPAGVYAGGVPVKEVPIPIRAPHGKGQTKYDDQFDRMIDKKVAIEVHEDHFQAMRRAIMRYREFRGLKGRLVVRQQLNPISRMVTMWFEIKEASNDKRHK